MPVPHILAAFYLFYIINARIYGGVVLSAYSDLIDNVFAWNVDQRFVAFFRGVVNVCISLTLTIPGIKKAGAG